MSKTDAREWREQQRAESKAKEELRDELEKLRYAGCKRFNMPDPATFENSGYPEAAQKIRQALRLLNEAYFEVNNAFD